MNNVVHSVAVVKFLIVRIAFLAYKTFINQMLHWKHHQIQIPKSVHIGEKNIPEKRSEKIPFSCVSVHHIARPYSIILHSCYQAFRYFQNKYLTTDKIKLYLLALFQGIVMILFWLWCMRLMMPCKGFITFAWFCLGWHLSFWSPLVSIKEKGR